MLQRLLERERTDHECPHVVAEAVSIESAFERKSALDLVGNDLGEGFVKIA